MRTNEKIREVFENIKRSFKTEFKDDGRGEDIKVEKSSNIFVRSFKGIIRFLFIIIIFSTIFGGCSLFRTFNRGQKEGITFLQIWAEIKQLEILSSSSVKNNQIDSDKEVALNSNSTLIELEKIRAEVEMAKIGKERELKEQREKAQVEERREQQLEIQKLKEAELRAETEKRRIELEKKKLEAEKIRQKNLINAIKNI